MRIIPVIDLKGGVVVHARQGQRESYRPINSPLCASSDVYEVLDAFLGVYPFETFYIADLNALTGNGNHQALLTRLLRDFPNIEFWIDRGYVAATELLDQPENYRPVLGSETLTDNMLAELSCFSGRYILSLDFFGDEARGSQVLFGDASYWPELVIVMTLGRVGGNQGPDYRRLEAFCRAYPRTQFIAAGGVRGYSDLLNLNTLGIRHVLIASALHDRRIGKDDIRCLEIIEKHTVPKVADKKIPR
ncbi:MAG: HisA/HisF-related TIM barrel protein [Gammaproteobacteria bacterium]